MNKYVIRTSTFGAGLTFRQMSDLFVASDVFAKDFLPLDSSGSGYLINVPFRFPFLSADFMAVDDQRLVSDYNVRTAPYAVAGRVVCVIVHDEGDFSFEADFSEYIKYKVKFTMEGAEVFGFVYVGLSNSTRTDSYKPFTQPNGGNYEGVQGVFYYEVSEIRKGIGNCLIPNSTVPSRNSGLAQTW